MVPCGIGHICKDLCRIIRQRHCSYKDLSASLLPILKSSAIYILPFPATGGLVSWQLPAYRRGRAHTKEKNHEQRNTTIRFQGRIIAHLDR